MVVGLIMLTIEYGVTGVDAADIKGKWGGYQSFFVQLRGVMATAVGVQVLYLTSVHDEW